jgi:hypothetical protein
VVSDHSGVRSDNLQARRGMRDGRRFLAPYTCSYCTEREGACQNEFQTTVDSGSVRKQRKAVEFV